MDLRALSAAYGINGKPLVSVANKPEEKKAQSFDQVLSKGFQKVSELQGKAEKAMMAMATGDVNDISEVAAAVSEADVALRFAVMIRDKLLDGYAQLIRMSV
ncbi:MAG: flagellar hook-basal body complex protein FliE [Thermovirga sp.]|nr:MAG: Flagellar hook-basal body complex protein FliE [Thermovirga lienii]MDN5318787.1 flagellar hook-basal body complex protein FliE [Thermovirga sp.]MDN5368385.1 flagellar hook-basal body complex protein FliE [Thermovirga sp.]